MIILKKILVTIFLLLLTITLFGQVTEKEKEFRTVKADSTKGWEKGGIIMINFGQTSLTNWAAGGENSATENGLFNFFANYKNGSLRWDNNISLGYGIIHQGSLSRKSDDKIDLSTKLAKQASKSWYYAALLNFKTQFAPGYNYPNDSIKISNFLAPAYLVIALGMDYRPKKYLSVFISPLSGRFTLVNDQKLADAGAFGVDPAEYSGSVKIKDGKKMREEFGGYIKVAFQKDIMTNVNLSSKLEAFSNYLKNPQNIAINWEMLLSLKVNKYIGASVATQLVYDDAVKYKNKGPRTQFKEILGIGFSYKF
ncbi:MAG: DUF3078 domain-containing protein [Bacteroidota bacterium]|nr:DUF3078 domain-containing protein [Bacteroidota bacterium]